MSSEIYFIYNQKLVIFSKDLTSVLLAKRQGEADYNATYTFIGGKLETKDKDVIAGMKREKDEEIGKQIVIKIMTNETYTVLYRKKDGDSVILPHIPAVYVSGEINLSDEYSDYKWVSLLEIDDFEPKVANIPEIARWAKNKLESSKSKLTEI